VAEIGYNVCIFLERCYYRNIINVQENQYGVRLTEC
jgi:hypothetical protein